MYELKAKKMIEEFLLEDIGEGDKSALALFPKEATGCGTFLVKAKGIVAGMDVIRWTYELLDKEIKVVSYFMDGEVVKEGDILAQVQGPIGSLLTGERVVLNLLQRMSGIATMTTEAVERLSSSVTRVCDTRKTMPGLRMFDKYSVTCGGGFNHRMGLYDAVMLKDNHIAFAGSIVEAVKVVRSRMGHTVKIEVEIETKEQLFEAIEAGADIIMFDNREPEEVKEWMTVVPSHIITEVSGGITLENIYRYQECGVHYISLGALTHSVKALDISFNIENE